MNYKSGFHLYIFLVLLVFIVTPGVYAADFYVTHAGQSLNEVRQAVREYKKGLPPKESLTVWLEKGTHYLDAPVGFDEKDSGNEEYPIVYRSKPGETVKISGGRKVNGFVPVTDEAILSRLDVSVHPYIVQADLSGWKGVDFGEPVPVFLQGQWPQTSNSNLLELFYGGKRMPLSRWPNAGYTTIKKAVGPTPHKEGNHTGTVEAHFTYVGSRPERWVNETDIYLKGFFFWDWASAFEKVESIDIQTKTIKAAVEESDILYPTPFPYHKYGHRDGQRYFALNFLSEIDSPGEWYFDRQMKILYFYPPDPLTNQIIELSVSKTLIRTTNASWITFQDMVIEQSRNDSIIINAGEGITFSNTVIRNSGRWAVIIQGGISHTIKDSSISQAAKGAVAIKNAGNRLTLTPSHHFITNNTIHKIGEIEPTNQGIAVDNSVGVTISHNELYDMTHSAIKLNGNDHLIEYNDIHHVVQETSDSGAIYLGRSWTDRGNIIRFNYFHDILPKVGGAVMAIYLDDMESGILIHGNIFDRVHRGIMLGGGRDHTITNNIFANSDADIYIDGRGVGSTIVGSPQHKQLLTMPYTTPPWSIRYPRLVNILKEEPGQPLGNLIEHNIFLNSGKLVILQKAEGLIEIKQNFKESTPNFNTVMRSNFQVDPKSKSLELGFTQLPFHKIGKH